MASAQPLNWSGVLMRGVLAGVAGAILIDAFLYAASLAPNHASILGLWQFIASSAFGKTAYTSLTYAWIGLVMHFIVSIAWGTGYSYLSDRQPAVNASPVFSGLVFGFIVYIVMQLALASVGLLVITSVAQVLIGICAHTIFFGIPVALVNDWQRTRLA